MVISNKRILLAFNSLIPASSPLLEASLKILFWYGMKQYCRISFNVFHLLNKKKL